MTLKIKRDNTPTVAFQVYNPDGSECDLSSVQDILFLAKTDQLLPNSQASITKSKSGGRNNLPAPDPPQSTSKFQVNLHVPDTKKNPVRQTFFFVLFTIDSSGSSETS